MRDLIRSGQLRILLTLTSLAIFAFDIEAGHRWRWPALISTHRTAVGCTDGRSIVSGPNRRR